LFTIDKDILVSVTGEKLWLDWSYHQQLFTLTLLGYISINQKVIDELAPFHPYLNNIFRFFIVATALALLKCLNIVLNLN